jgi:ABC-type polysaccharide/polyol phosphate export permease
LAPFVALSLVGFLAGVNLILACFNVFFRDIQHVLEPVLSLVFYATPIIFSRQNEMVPPKVAELLGWNPMTHYVEVFRNCVFHTENVVSPYQFLLVMLLPIPSLAIGWLVYKKTRRHILFRI